MTLLLIQALVLVVDGGLDAAVAATSIDFGAGETEEQPEMVTSRKETEFGTLLPERFRQDEGEETPAPAPATSRRRGGCSGCAAIGGSSDGVREAVSGLVVAILLLGRRKRRLRG